MEMPDVLQIDGAKSLSWEIEVELMWTGISINWDDFLIQKEFQMNKDQIEGTIKDAAGKVQQKTGEILGNDKQQVKGLVKQAEGKTQKTVGDIKNAAKK